MIYLIIDAKKAEHKIGVSCKLMGSAPLAISPGGIAAVKGAVFAVTRLPWRMSESAFA